MSRLPSWLGATIWLASLALWLAPHWPRPLHGLLPLPDETVKAMGRILGPLGLMAISAPSVFAERDAPAARVFLFFMAMLAVGLLGQLAEAFGVDLPPTFDAAIGWLLGAGFVLGACWLFYVNVLKPSPQGGWLARGG